MKNRRCARGHFIPATTTTDVCVCALKPRQRRPRRYLFGADLWGQGLAARNKYRIRTLPLTGSYL